LGQWLELSKRKFSQEDLLVVEEFSQVILEFIQEVFQAPQKM
jgi:hypothetical protein